MRLAILCSGFAVLLLAGQWREAKKQPPAQEEPIIRVDVNLVNIYATVRTKQGGLVNDLNKEDFLIREDGKDQTLSLFSRETDLPLTIGLLVDCSVSQERLIMQERRTAAAFFEQVLRPKDLAFLIAFGSEAELLQDLTGSPRALTRALDDLRVIGSAGGLHPGPVPTASQPRGTILFDAVYLAATDRLRGEVGRKAIILITDGVDQGSRVKLQEAIEVAHKSDAIIYSIHAVDYGFYQQAGYYSAYPGDGDLKKMSEETGGRLFRIDRKHTLDDIFREIQEELRSQYAFGYSSSNPVRDGGFRRVEIKAKDRDLRVQARKGYYATP